jgi:hypothetical protein
VRTGVWLWLMVALALSGCQGDYPIEPTACDRYCHATKDLLCEYYEPSGCVQQCERDEKSNPLCSVPFEATIACFESTPGAAEEYCSFGSFGGDDLPCRAEQEAFSTCWSLLVGYGNGP